ncbi:MAG: carboxypeptidase-like regulatory domain-containing protein [Planctomycetota bacterium]
MKIVRWMVGAAFGLGLAWVVVEIAEQADEGTALLVESRGVIKRGGVPLAELGKASLGRSVVDLGTVVREVDRASITGSSDEPLADGRVVNFEVVNPAFEPVPSALIYVAGAGAHERGDARRVSAQGMATFSAENLEGTVVAVQAPGFGSEIVSIPEVADGLYRVVLRPGASISGTVTSAAGSGLGLAARVVAVDPVRDVVARAAMAEALGRGSRRMSRIDSEGRFEIGGLVAGREYVLHLTGSGICDAPNAGRERVRAGTSDVLVEAHFLGGAELRLPPGADLVDQLPRYGVLGEGTASQAFRSDRTHRATQIPDDAWSIALDPDLCRFDPLLANSNRLYFSAPTPDELEFTLDYRLDVPVLGIYQGRGDIAPLCSAKSLPVIELRSTDPYAEDVGELHLTINGYAARDVPNGHASDLRLALTRVMDDRQEMVFVHVSRERTSDPGIDTCRVIGVPAGDYRLDLFCTATGWKGSPSTGGALHEVLAGEVTQASFDLSNLGSVEIVPFTSDGEAYTGRLQIDLMRPADSHLIEVLPSLPEGAAIVEVGPRYSALGSSGVVFDGPPYRINYVPPGTGSAVMLSDYTVFGAETDLIPVSVAPGGHQGMEVVLASY